MCRANSAKVGSGPYSIERREIYVSCGSGP
jgi:hypothetical protein